MSADQPPDGGGDNGPPQYTAEQLAMIKEAMMEELGIGRIANLALADRPVARRGNHDPSGFPSHSTRGGRGGGRGATRGPARGVTRGGHASTASAWQNFAPDDVDPEEAALDIAGGQLYRQRQGDGQVSSSRNNHHGGGPSNRGRGGGFGHSIGSSFNSSSSTLLFSAIPATFFNDHRSLDNRAKNGYPIGVDATIARLKGFGPHSAQAPSSSSELMQTPSSHTPSATQPARQLSAAQPARPSPATQPPKRQSAWGAISMDPSDFLKYAGLSGSSVGPNQTAASPASALSPVPQAASIPTPVPVVAATLPTPAPVQARISAQQTPVIPSVQSTQPAAPALPGTSRVSAVLKDGINQSRWAEPPTKTTQSVVQTPSNIASVPVLQNRNAKPTWGKPSTETTQSVALAVPSVTCVPAVANGVAQSVWSEPAAKTSQTATPALSDAAPTPVLLKSGIAQSIWGAGPAERSVQEQRLREHNVQVAKNNGLLLPGFARLLKSHTSGRDLILELTQEGVTVVREIISDDCALLHEEGSVRIMYKASNDGDVASPTWTIKFTMPYQANKFLAVVAQNRQGYLIGRPSVRKPSSDRLTPSRVPSVSAVKPSVLVEAPFSDPEPGVSLKAVNETVTESLFNAAEPSSAQPGLISDAELVTTSVSVAQKRSSSQSVFDFGGLMDEQPIALSEFRNPLPDLSHRNSNFGAHIETQTFNDMGQIAGFTPLINLDEEEIEVVQSGNSFSAFHDLNDMDKEKFEAVQPEETTSVLQDRHEEEEIEVAQPEDNTAAHDRNSLYDEEISQSSLLYLNKSPNGTLLTQLSRLAVRKGLPAVQELSGHEILRLYPKIAHNLVGMFLATSEVFSGLPDELSEMLMKEQTYRILELAIVGHEPSIPTAPSSSHLGESDVKALVTPISTHSEISHSTQAAPVSNVQVRQPTSEPMTPSAGLSNGSTSSRPASTSSRVAEPSYGHRDNPILVEAPIATQASRVPLGAKNTNISPAKAKPVASTSAGTAASIAPGDLLANHMSSLHKPREKSAANSASSQDKKFPSSYQTPLFTSSNQLADSLEGSQLTRADTPKVQKMQASVTEFQSPVPIPSRLPANSSPFVMEPMLSNVENPRPASRPAAPVPTAPTNPFASNQRLPGLSASKYAVESNSQWQPVSLAPIIRMVVVMNPDGSYSEVTGMLKTGSILIIAHAPMPQGFGQGFPARPNFHNPSSELRSDRTPQILKATAAPYQPSRSSLSPVRQDLQARLRNCLASR